MTAITAGTCDHLFEFGQVGDRQVMNPLADQIRRGIDQADDAKPE